MKTKQLFKKPNNLGTNLFTQFVKKRFCILMITLLLPLGMTAQSEPEVIQQWTVLEEAEFYFDVSYTVVKCSPTATPVVLMNAFNEGGIETNVGFTLALTDANGNTAEVTIPLFQSNLADMFIASCDSDEHANLRFEVPQGMDANSLSISITYNTGS